MRGSHTPGYYRVRREHAKSETRKPKPERRPKPEARSTKRTHNRRGEATAHWIKPFSDFGLRRSFGFRFVLPKLHAKWLQYFVARNVFLDFLWAYFSAARPHIYKHLREQEHWYCGTRRPRVSRNCDFGRWRSFVSFWFWLCQFRVSDFGLRNFGLLALFTPRPGGLQSSPARHRILLSNHRPLWHDRASRMNRNEARPVEILLVEDSPSDTELTLEALRDFKVRNHVSVVEDGVQAMQFLRREGSYAQAPRPDMIMLDLNLPRKDGREVLADIKSDDRLKTIPIVVMTTSRAKQDVLRAYQLSANCYINKPVDFKQFLEVVRSIESFWLYIVTLPPAPKAGAG